MLSTLCCLAITPPCISPPASAEVIMLNTDAHSSQIKNKMTKVTPSLNPNPTRNPNP